MTFLLASLYRDRDTSLKPLTPRCGHIATPTQLLVVKIAHRKCEERSSAFSVPCSSRKSPHMLAASRLKETKPASLVKLPHRGSRLVGFEDTSFTYFSGTSPHFRLKDSQPLSVGKGHIHSALGKMQTEGTLLTTPEIKGMAKATAGCHPPATESLTPQVLAQMT